MTLLCVPIFVQNLPQARRDISLAAEAGADLIELRLDDISDEQEIRQIVQASLLPCILTCRPTSEGGRSLLDDEARARLLSAGAVDPARYIDFELKAIEHLGKITGPPDVKLILSSHDFSGRPDKLHNLILRMNAAPAINKIVWTARTVRDNLEALDLLRTRQKPTIALCMGEAGIVSRLLAKKFGGFLTFASLKANEGTAPGQVTIDDMKRLYRWDAIGPQTKVYGVVGSPIAHSMSPAIHNAAFEQTGHDGIYLPLLVNEGYESFKAFMESFVPFEGLDLSGLSITIPHKENALRYLTEKGADVEPLAREIGAVNTILIERRSAETKLSGRNTDFAAILDSITTKLGVSRDHLAEYRIAVIGAGGTGRTAVAALAHYGATVVVYNRTRARADALATEFNGKRGKVVAADLDKLCDSCCQIYINTTSIGMHPSVKESAFGSAPPNLAPQTIVFDTVYNPMKTLLLRQVESAGAQTIGGVEMFVRQAAAQFTAWTGAAAPVELMRKIVESRLSS